MHKCHYSVLSLYAGLYNSGTNCWFYRNTKYFVRCIDTTALLPVCFLYKIWRDHCFNRITLQRRYNAVVGSHEHWPRYTWSALYWTWQPHPLEPLQFPPVIMRYYTLHVCYIVCSFFIYLFFIFFIVETLCMYLTWLPFYSFNPVNNKFLSLHCFVFFLIIQGN